MLSLPLSLSLYLSFSVWLCLFLSLYLSVCLSFSAWKNTKEVDRDFKQINIVKWQIIPDFRKEEGARAEDGTAEAGKREQMGERDGDRPGEWQGNIKPADDTCPPVDAAESWPQLYANDIVPSFLLVSCFCFMWLHHLVPPPPPPTPPTLPSALLPTWYTYTVDCLNCLSFVQCGLSEHLKHRRKWQATWLCSEGLW